MTGVEIDFVVSNFVFSDPFGYVWMLHEVRQDVSFEERCAHFEKLLEE